MQFASSVPRRPAPPVPPPPTFPPLVVRTGFFVVVYRHPDTSPARTSARSAPRDADRPPSMNDHPRILIISRRRVKVNSLIIMGTYVCHGIPARLFLSWERNLILC